MRLAAIYIEDHDYLFDQPQTINFGGKYFYEFSKKKDEIIVKRKLNENFIEGFFDLTNLETKLTAINAIVGQNGSGKSTLLDIIRGKFVREKYALPQSSCVFLAEIENKEVPTILKSDFREVILEETVRKRTKRTRLTSGGGKSIGTIYYSPHYDYKYNPNFDNVDDHDISFDTIIRDDLQRLNEKGTNANGFSYSPTQELLFKNSIRQIEFLSSGLVSEQNIFKDLFHLQEHYEPTLFFRGYLTDEKNWNTPNQLRHPLQEISKKIEQEHKNWHKVRKFKGDRLLNQVDVTKYILKRNILDYVISLLYKQMERRNTYLDEGDFPDKLFNEQLPKLDAYNLFLFFIENASLKMRNGRKQKIFKGDTARVLISKIYEAIDAVKKEDDITNSSIKTTTKRTIEILKLQRQFLNDLNKYYFIFNTSKETIPDRDIIEEFVNYMPFSRRMSSGENALLNFFSRLYTFLDFNFKGNKFLEVKKHYILLLDEADLSFHPSWKKRYVKALIKTIPYFFDELQGHPSVQIVFTTHDSLTLSDLPNSNVIYIERRDYDSQPAVLNVRSENRPTKTFGANISDLLAASFFVEDSLIGEFAFDRIRETITWLENKIDTEGAEYYRKVIQMIDEPIVQRKLAEMYDDKMQTNFQLNVVSDQIKELEALRTRLQK